MVKRETGYQEAPGEKSIVDLFFQFAKSVRKDAETLSLEQLGLPRMYGYAEAQQQLKAENLIVSGQLDYPELLIERMEAENKREKGVEAFLEWCKNQFNLRFLYYPMCGWHITPREVFGAENVVHLSNDDYNPYLTDLGYGLRIMGKVQQQPIVSNVFDAIYLRGWDISKSDLDTTFGHFRCVLKEDGIFIIEINQNRNIVKYAEKHLEPAALPDEIRKDMKGWFGLYQNKDKIQKQRKFFGFPTDRVSIALNKITHCK